MSAKKLNQETLAMAAGALLLLAFSCIPGLLARYAARTLFVSSFLIFVFLIRQWFPSRMSHSFLRFLFEYGCLLGCVSEYASFMKNISGANSSSGFAWPMRCMPAFIRYGGTV